MEYGLFIRNSRTGRWINLSTFAKVFHHWTGEPASGGLVDVPGMDNLVMPVRTAGSGYDAWHSGSYKMHRRTATSLGLSGATRAWHAVTLISDSSQPEGVADDLESVVGAGCLLNYSDNCFYSSPPDIHRYTHLPVRILAGVVYE